MIRATQRPLHHSRRRRSGWLLTTWLLTTWQLWACLLATILLWTLPVSAENWPAQRGPQQNGVSNETGFPTSWSPGGQRVWKTPLAGTGSSSPIIWEDQVFVTSTSGRGHRQLHLQSFDVHSGWMRWHRRLTGARTSESLNAAHQLAGHASATPVTDGERLIAFYATGEIGGFELQGEPLWFRSLEEDFGELHCDPRAAVSPVLAEDLVILPLEHARGSSLIALDADSGSPVWQVDARGTPEHWTTPLVIDHPFAGHVGQTCLLCSGSQRLALFDLETGRELWSRRHDHRCSSTHLIPLEMFTFLILENGSRLRRITVAIDDSSSARTTRSTASAPEWSIEALKEPQAAVVCTQELCFCIGESGLLTCLDQTDGQTVWQHRLEGTFQAAPVVAGDQVFLTNNEGQTFVIKAARDYRLVGNGDVAEPVTASPALSQGHLILRTGRSLHGVRSAKHGVRSAETEGQP